MVHFRGTYAWTVTREELTAAHVEAAAAVLADVVHTTPLEHSPRLSQLIGAEVVLKRENRQIARSYKVRGAFHAIQALDADERARGVVCASAGNHAQGLALAAAKLGIKATIVMPRTTPNIKVDAMRARGAKVVLHGDTYDEASQLKLFA